MESYYEVYYKGTKFFKTVCDDPLKTIQECKKIAKDSIKLRLKNGESMQDIKIDIKNKMDMMENLLRVNCVDMINKECVEKTLKDLNTTFDEMVKDWTLYVSMMLNLKMIQDDDLNGFLCIIV